MFPRLFAVIFVFYLAHAEDTNTSQPLCQVCSCKSDYSGTAVDCKVNNIKEYINKTEYWNQNGTLYNYSNLTIEDVALISLDVQFPESNLQLLNLGGNSIKNISEAVFRNLQNMSTLILSHNEIDLIDPNAFKGKYTVGDLEPLRSLKVLKLDYNKIHSLNQDIFEHTSRMEVLYLNNNPLNVIDHQTLVAITDLVYLRVLDLSYTGIATLPDNFLHTPKFLKFLNLAGNKMEGIPRTLGDAQSLETLIMNNNPIVNLTKQNGFPKVLSLRVLHMCQMDNLTSIGRHAFTGLEKLEKLYLAGNDVLGEISDNAICDSIDDIEYTMCPPLKELYINDNQLTHINQPLIAHWDKLKVLDIRDNPWSCDCENQWMVDELMPIYMEINPSYAKQLRCAAPPEMLDHTFLELSQKRVTLRCLDRYGNRPERDAALLVGILAGLLIAIPLVLLMVYAYQRNWFGYFGESPAAYSRKYYRRTTSEDYFY